MHSDIIESPDEIKEKLLAAAQVLGAEKIWANPDCGLRTRTWDVAFAKLQNLVEGARLAREAMASRG